MAQSGCLRKYTDRRQGTDAGPSLLRLTRLGVWREKPFDRMAPENRQRGQCPMLSRCTPSSPSTTSYVLVVFFPSTTNVGAWVSLIPSSLIAVRKPQLFPIICFVPSTLLLELVDMPLQSPRLSFVTRTHVDAPTQSCQFSANFTFALDSL
jgi:hypothetical protein